MIFEGLNGGEGGRWGCGWGVFCGCGVWWWEINYSLESNTWIAINCRKKKGR